MKKKTCDTCEYLCPFVEEELGNCEIDMKEVEYETYVCPEYKKRKGGLHG